MKQKYLRVTGSTTFKAEAESGVVYVEFKLDSSKLENREVVAYEILVRDGYMVADHQDLLDKNQVVRFYNIEEEVIGMRTEAYDKVTKTHTITNSKNAVVTDTVEYWGLDHGSTYWLHTILYNQTKGMKLVDMWTQFKADVYNPFLDVDIEFDSRPFAGDTLVVSEGFYVGDPTDRQWLYSHPGDDDEAQRVVVSANAPTELLETGDFTGWIAIGGLAVVVVGFVVLLVTSRRKKKF